MHNFTLATALGLCVAFAGSFLLPAPVAWSSDSRWRVRVLLPQVLLWGLLGVLLAIVVWGEHRSLESLGWRSWNWQAVMWGLVAAALIRVVLQLSFPWLSRIGLVDFGQGLPLVLTWPLSIRIVAAITAGVVEETFYRGYALERLKSLTGSYWWAVGLAVAVFALAHLPLWGKGVLIPVIFSGAAFSALYVWRRDLLACIVAHATLDFIALVADPMFLTRKP